MSSSKAKGTNKTLIKAKNSKGEKEGKKNGSNSSSNNMNKINSNNSSDVDSNNFVESSPSTTVVLARTYVNPKDKKEEQQEIEKIKSEREKRRKLHDLLAHSFGDSNFVLSDKSNYDSSPSPVCCCTCQEDVKVSEIKPKTKSEHVIEQKTKDESTSTADDFDDLKTGKDSGSTLIKETRQKIKSNDHRNESNDINPEVLNGRQKTLINICYKCALNSTLTVVFIILFATALVLSLVSSPVRKLTSPYYKTWIVDLVGVGIGTVIFLACALIRILFFTLIICTKQRISKHYYIKRLQMIISDILPILGRIEACLSFFELGAFSLTPMIHQTILMQTFHWVTFGICMLSGLVYIVITNIFPTITRTKVYKTVISEGISVTIFLTAVNSYGYVKIITPIKDVFISDALSVFNEATNLLLTNSLKFSILILDAVFFVLPFIVFFYSISWQIDNLLTYTSIEANSGGSNSQCVCTRRKKRWYHKREVSIFMLTGAIILNYLYNIILILETKEIGLRFLNNGMDIENI